VLSTGGVAAFAVALERKTKGKQRRENNGVGSRFQITIIAERTDAVDRAGIVGQRLSARQLEAIEQLLCPEAPGRLPLAYRRFLLKHNGGRPEPAHFQWRDKDGEQDLEVHDFLGIDPGPLDAPGMDCVRVTLQYRSLLPKYAIPVAHLELDGLLLLFTAGPARNRSGAGARVGPSWRGVTSIRKTTLTSSPTAFPTS
jgi:hypothetical protein